VPLPGSNSRSFASDAGAGRHGRPLGLVSQGNRMFGRVEKWTGARTIQVVYPTPAPCDQGSIPLVGDQSCPSNCPAIETHLVSPRDDLDGAYPRTGRTLRLRTQQTMPPALSRWRHGFESRWGCFTLPGQRTSGQDLDSALPIHLTIFARVSMNTASEESLMK
jgi:hypothetical protein